MCFETAKNVFECYNIRNYAAADEMYYKFVRYGEYQGRIVKVVGRNNSELLAALRDYFKDNEIKLAD